MVLLRALKEPKQVNHLRFGIREGEVEGSS